MSDPLQIMYPEGKKITVGNEEFAIKPFVLVNRTKVLKIISEAILQYGKVNPDMNLKNMEVGLNLFQSIIDIAGERLVDIYEIALGKPKEWLLENVSIKDEFEILTAISEVNDLPFLFAQVKSLLKGIKKTS